MLDFVIVGKRGLSISVEKTQKGDVTITAKIPFSVWEEYQKRALATLATRVKITGFRQGKAPLELVKQKIGSEKISQEALQVLVGEIYQKAVLRQKLSPVVKPKITKLVMPTKKKEGVVVLETAVIPEFTLGEWRQVAQAAGAGDKIWTPQRGKTQFQKQDQQKRVRQILQALAEKIKIDLPELLIQQEVTKKLVALVEDLQKVGLRMEDYLASKNLTPQQLRKQLRQTVVWEWKTHLILLQIAKEVGIQPTKEELSRPPWNQVPPQLASVLYQRQKALEYLATL